MAAEAGKYRAPALEKGLDILEALSTHVDGLSQAEIAKTLDRSQSEIYRMLDTLVRRGYVVRGFDGERYSLSLRMFAMSQRHPPISRLLNAAAPRMRELTRKAWQSCHMGMESNGDIVVVASAESPGNWGLSLRVGTVIGLSNTGTGRVLAAFRSEEALERLLETHRLAVGEPEMDRIAFMDEIAKIREIGFAKMPSATAVGVTNLAYPVFGADGVAAAVLNCPFLERIDDLDVPSLEDVHEMYLGLSTTLSKYYSGHDPMTDAQEE
ncbi:IclR family transcriptional regulator [Planktotalea sp.]|uniref:IclR family transcriptional regulator n=1 Tax=Planktotalea sp. TaxID=2029877 RepID=UPI0032987796